MQITCLQHVPIEGPGKIADWAAMRGHEIMVYPLFESCELPAPETVEWLLIMGGPMGVNDESAYPWLVQEKQFIQQVITQTPSCPILGICLGAQLLAHVLGATVQKNPQPEFGWWPITLSDNNHKLLTDLPRKLTVLHWHNDTFAIPAGAQLLTSSIACENQAFVYRNNIVGLQFHVELDVKMAAQWTIECAADLHPPSQYVQTAEQIMAEPARFAQLQQYLYSLLDNLVSQ